MTTKDSPHHLIHAQAEVIAKKLKAMEPRCNGKDHLKSALFMDDRVIQIELTWEKISELTEPELTALVCGVMRATSAPDHRKMH